MKTLTAFLFTCLMTLGLSTLNAQIVVFSDDFESNINSPWTKTGTWALTTTQKHGGSRSITDSPSGPYTNNTNTSISLTNGVSLDSCLDAELSFWAIYDIELGFDYCYVDVTDDNWNSYTRIATFNGEQNLTPWQKYTYSLGGFIGKGNVKIRFLLYTDPGYTADGIYIDDLTITKDTVDQSPPLILHTPPAHYESSLGSQFLSATIVDTSGIGLAELVYTVDGGSPSTITGINTFGDQYAFTIPSQPAGSWVDYYVVAEDTAVVPNRAETDTFSYITGNHIYYDNAVVSFVNNFGAAGTGGQRIAVRITFPGTTHLVTALVRNYTDINNPNDSIDVHIWEDSSGLPGADIIPPIRIFPEATLLNTNVMTRVDLRPYSAQLSNVTGDVFIGYTTPSGRAWTSYTTGGTANRSYIFNNGTWTQSTGNDYHFRAVSDVVLGTPFAGFTVDSINDPTFCFTDTSQNSPTDWYWEFGDSQVDSIQNPCHTYTANGVFQVCLTASNQFGNDKICKYIVVNNVAPVAGFSFNLQNDPTVTFSDLSINNPTNWEWNFGDGSPLINVRHPSHTFDSNSTYQVCLKVWNNIGADSICHTLSTDGYKLPVASFDYEIVSHSDVQFYDSSTNNPTAWLWAFGNTKSGTVQNPLHTYTKNQKYVACLVASNGAGSSNPFCRELVIQFIGEKELSNESEQFSIYPNPTYDQVIFNPGSLSSGTLLVQDIHGKEIIRATYQKGQIQNLDLSGLQSGAYFVRISSENKVFVKKLLVE